MTAMSPEPAHARPKPGRAGGIGAAWAILLGMGATSVTYNVVHAVHGGALNICLALVYGIAPVYGAALLSHVVAVHGGGKFMQAITFLLMLGAMGLSIGATAAVVRPVAGVWMQWLFGVVIDGASLVALRVILNDRTARTTAAAEIEAVQERLRTALAEAREAVAHRSRLEAELAAVRAELGAELEALKSELATAVQAATSDRKRTRSSGPKRRAASPPNKAEPSPPNSRVPSDVDTQAEALRILATEPDISGGELGRRLGKSERYGCMLKNRLAPAVPGPDQVGE